MGFKQYLVGGNGLPQDISIGGVPLFSDDIKQLETNAKVFGLYSMLKGFAVILNGVKISNINTDSNTCDVSKGLILLNDVVYEVDAIVGQTYPFSLKKGAEVIDSRIFRDGNLKDVAIEYDYTVRTNFQYPDGNPSQDRPYPSDIVGGEEIYFDPFTSQKAEYIIDNLSKTKGEFKMGIWNSSNNIRTKDELGLTIQGSTQLRNFTSTGLGRWKHYGYFEITTDERNIRLSNIAQGASFGGSDTNEATLTRQNIPPHTHDSGTYKTDIQGEHNHNFTQTGDLTLDSNGSFPLLRQDGNISFTGDGGMTLAGEHEHDVQGYSGDGTQFNGTGNLRNDPFSIENAYKNVSTLQYDGYSDFALNDTGYFYPIYVEGTYYNGQQSL